MKDRVAKALIGFLFLGIYFGLIPIFIMYKIWNYIGPLIFFIAFWVVCFIPLVIRGIIMIKEAFDKDYPEQ